MASLNWTMLTESGQPLPLPGEKIISCTPSVTLSLFPSLPGANMSAKPPTDGTEYTSAKGSAYISNKRVVYVKHGITGAQGGQLESSRGEQNSSGASATSHPSQREALRYDSASCDEGCLTSSYLSRRCFTVHEDVVSAVVAFPRRPLRPTMVRCNILRSPLHAFRRWRSQCEFSASQGGAVSRAHRDLWLGLSPPSRVQSPHILRLTFRESGGGTFYETVSEMKERLGQSQGSGRGTPIEALRKWLSSLSPSSKSSVADHQLSSRALKTVFLSISKRCTKQAQAAQTRPR